MNYHMYCIVSILFSPPGLCYATDKLFRVQWTEGKTSQPDVGTMWTYDNVVSFKDWFY